MGVLTEFQNVVVSLSSALLHLPNIVVVVDDVVVVSGFVHEDVSFVVRDLPR